MHQIICSNSCNVLLFPEQLVSVLTLIENYVEGYGIGFDSGPHGCMGPL